VPDEKDTGLTLLYRDPEDADVCRDPVSVTVVQARILDISFLDGGASYGGDNEHPMLRNSGTDGGWGDGEAIADPVWQDASGDGTPEKNEPVCYTRSSGETEATRSRIRVTVGVKVEPGGVNFTLKGKKDGDPYFEGGGTSTGARQDLAMVGLQNLPATVERLSVTFDWSVAANPDIEAGLPVSPVNSAHTVYVVYATPITSIAESGTDYSNNLTPRRLDFSIADSGTAGESDRIVICDKSLSE